jgi:ubiquinone/menaquinone biosynthesis C-methylase UbiE
MTAFDERASTYQSEVQRSIAFANVDHADVIARKVQHLLALCSIMLGPPRQQRVLDVGCGIGLTDALLVGQVRELHGIDISPESVERARASNPCVRYTSFDGRAFPLADASIDLAFAICVLHHVPLEQRATFAAEMRRVVRPGGVAVIFEHNPFNPVTRVAVSRCELDRDAILARQGETAQLLTRAGLRIERRSYIIFTPSTRWSTRIDRFLGWLPAGAQYYVAARRPA